MKKLFAMPFLILAMLTVAAQEAEIDSSAQKQNLKFKYPALLVPTVFLGYGIIGLESHLLIDLNFDTKTELNEHIDKRLTIDNFSQYAPFLAVYGLNAFGVKGRNDFQDRTLILGTAYLIMGGTVNIIKRTGTVERPDGSSTSSFPSGHTATAFMGAEFLYQEYRDVSIWYGVSGYLVAAGTGFLRMYNNKHWLTDVAAGAGIGILSTKIAYWVHPVIKKTFFNKKQDRNGMFMPYYNGKQYGFGAAMTF